MILPHYFSDVTYLPEMALQQTLLLFRGQKWQVIRGGWMVTKKRKFIPIIFPQSSNAGFKFTPKRSVDYYEDWP